MIAGKNTHRSGVCCRAVGQSLPLILRAQQENALNHLIKLWSIPHLESGVWIPSGGILSLWVLEVLLKPDVTHRLA